MNSELLTTGRDRIVGQLRFLPALLLLVTTPAWGAIATDVLVSTGRSVSDTTITSPTFSTTAPNELLLAFVAADGYSPGTTVTAITTSGLTWVLVQRTNVQLGTAEIWRAFAPSIVSGVTARATLSQGVAASITVVGFTGVETSGTSGSGAIGATGSSGANPGAPSATLATTRGNSWVWGVGNDWDHAVDRTVGPGQTLVDQYLATVGDTYWVQRQTVATAVSGTSVTINDLAPSEDRYNLSIVEVLPAAQSSTSFGIAGSITPAANGAGTTVQLSGPASATTTADATGNYGFAGLANGSYTVTPSKSGFTFNPVSQPVSINGLSVGNVDFAATANTPPLNYPDLSDIIPTGQISVVGSGASRMFQYTHDTFNGGSGPLVIQPVYNQASGNYQGIQYVYSFTNGTWTLAQQIPIAGVFVFDAAHGHFHFPFTTYGLYGVAPGGGIGSPVALSGKTGFCIADSFIYDAALPNAGALGNLGSCGDPTSLRGLDIGAVDEYDQTDEGQSISLAGVPDGTYWLRAIVDPNNFLAESDKSNNETDVLLTITGNTVQVIQTVTPVLPDVPGITLTSPDDGATLAGTVVLGASSAVTTGVQFLLDGQALGGIVTTTPYAQSWDTTGVANGSHWLAVQTTDANGRTGTSEVAVVTVSNGSTQDTTPPTVQIDDPTANATVSASVAVSATAADNSAVANVQFYVDGAALGTPLTAPPYIVYWNTLTVSDGQHTMTASATDTAGLVGTSAPVRVNVDNSHPPNLIGKDVTVFADGLDTMQTPPFSTSTPDDLLIAFVAYDGPKGAPQTATVSGAGLTWTLLKRSNVQSGTAEIWAARASDTLTNVTVLSQPGVASGYHGSMTVVAFTNASGPGVVGQASAPSGAPDIYLPGVSAGSWVFAVGNDWDRAADRTPVSGQVLVHQRVDRSVGDTYWVQSTTAPSTAFALVEIFDSAPTDDQWNYCAVEIVATRR